ncbi:unnamed protein product [Choristocarpus tenellus]
MTPREPAPVALAAGSAMAGKGDEQSTSVVVLFALLDLPPENRSLGLAAEVLQVLVRQSGVAAAVARGGMLERLLRVLAEEDVMDVESTRWGLLHSLCVHTEVSERLLSANGFVVLLGVLVGYKGFTSSLGARQGAARVLCGLLRNRNVGQRASAMLSRFLPPTLVSSLGGTGLGGKVDAKAAVAAFDASHETPELVWTSEMRSELQEALDGLLRHYMQTPRRYGTQRQYHDDLLQLPADFRVRFRCLSSEVTVGGVYLRLFLRSPLHELKNPGTFLDGLMNAWAHGIEQQVAPLRAHVGRTGLESQDGAFSNLRGGVTGARVGEGHNAGVETALVTASGSDLLELYTSCIVLLVKGGVQFADDMVAWGFLPLVVGTLRVCVDAGARGTPQVCCVRILHELGDKQQCVAAMAEADSSTAALLLSALLTPAELGLTRCGETDQIGGSATTGTLVPEASFVLDTLKRIIGVRGARGWEALVSEALDQGLVSILMEHIVEKETMDSGVLDPSTAKVYAISVLKTLSTDPAVRKTVKDQLAPYQGWGKYSDQDHSLFLAKEQQVDHFLTDGTEVLGRKLLTALSTPPSGLAIVQTAEIPSQPDIVHGKENLTGPSSSTTPNQAHSAAVLSTPPPPRPSDTSSLVTEGVVGKEEGVGTSEQTKDGFRSQAHDINTSPTIPVELDQVPRPMPGSDSRPRFTLDQSLLEAEVHSPVSKVEKREKPSLPSFLVDRPVQISRSIVVGEVYPPKTKLSLPPGGREGDPKLASRKSALSGNVAVSKDGRLVSVHMIRGPTGGLGIDLRKQGEHLVVKGVRPEAVFTGEEYLMPADTILTVKGQSYSSFSEGVALLKSEASTGASFHVTVLRSEENK